MLGLTLAFGWVLVLDVRLYGSLPDPALLPIQTALAASTLVAFLGWRWAPAVTAIVAFAAGVGSAVQPVTLLRLTDPEHVWMGLGTVLVLGFAAATAVAGAAETARRVRAGHRRPGTRPRSRHDSERR